MSTDPLLELVVDESALAREELAAVLAPYLRFTRSGDLLPTANFNELTTRDRVLCVLLAFRAANLLELRETAGATPQEIVEASGMAPGTVRPKLSELGRDRLVVKSNSRYVVPIHATPQVVKTLTHGRSRTQGGKPAAEAAAEGFVTDG